MMFRFARFYLNYLLYRCQEFTSPVTILSLILTDPTTSRGIRLRPMINILHHDPFYFYLLNYKTSRSKTTANPIPCKPVKLQLLAF